MCLPRVSSIFKKISPKTFGPHCIYKSQFVWETSIGKTNSLTLCREIMTMFSYNRMNVSVHYMGKIQDF